jgi:hypothetical protein
MWAAVGAAASSVSIRPSRAPIWLASVAAKSGSSPSAAASSFSVSSVPGALSTRAAVAACTKAVVAIWVVFVPAVAVGAAGVPVKVGEASGAFASSAVCRPVTVLIACAPVWLVRSR